MVLALGTFRVVCVVWSLMHSVGWGLRLGAFNAQVFGPSKADKPEVMAILAKIVARYDILLFQEVKDSSGQAIQKLLQQVKQDHGIVFSMSISDRLGRTRSKEQYAFLYRKDRGISLVDSFHFDDGDESVMLQVGNKTEPVDLFQREPYIVRFRAANCKVRDLSLVALHTMPTRTVQELTALSQVVQTVRETWDTHNIVILGDLNADCNYVPKKDWPHIALKHDPDFWWAIDDDQDTTVNHNTDCAYDRFIVGGQALRKAVVTDSAAVFDFQAHYGLSSDQALGVSDHYPIEMTLQDITDVNTNSGSSIDGGTSRTVVKVLHKVWQALAGIFSSRHSDNSNEL